MRLSRLPREARRTRKPKQPNWVKYPNKSCWIQCTYYKCGHCWKYSGGKNWAECPVCHTSSKVATAKKSFVISKVATEKNYGQENNYEDNFTME
ncbi:MAG TPA: hypothetical protein VN704_09905 [Verrucomicrobiae bacterium]|nr:hypothetical protein [Verrucomicrobiae bacterium]